MQLVAENGQVVVLASHRLGKIPGDFRIEDDQRSRYRTFIGQYPPDLTIDAGEDFGQGRVARCR